jgi:hypothetical protein
MDDTDFQIDKPVLAEGRNRHARFCVEFREAVTSRDVDDALVAASISPIRQAASGELARGDAGALALSKAV